jgi:hypothetical protein
MRVLSGQKICANFGHASPGGILASGEEVQGQNWSDFLMTFDTPLTLWID